MDNYANTKFSFVGQNKGLSIVNIDDKRIHAAFEAERFPCAKTVSTLNRDADIYVSNIEPGEYGFTCGFESENQFLVDARLPLMGRFNLENVAIAYAVATCLGANLSADQVSRLKPVAGRLERVVNTFSIFVDYAHTPDALEKTLIALKQHIKTGLVLVFGCGGDRDTGKRPQMAQVAEKHADQIIVTSDNPRTESPQKIIQDICRGFSSPEKVTVELDRARAIRLAINSSNDRCVLIAGKGHEDYQEIDGVRHPFSDREQVLRCVA
jgi:UDP-N-acetylmuramoyl-L-alanyl-D-glutamate--2,6-diaminopimelate ligase